MRINLPTGISTSTQVPLNYKLFFKTLQEVIDLGTDDFKAFLYHDQMLVFCIENQTEYIWRSRRRTTPLDEEGLIDGGFTYPAGSIVDGIDYSNKEYNFYVYNSDKEFTNGPNRILSGNIFWHEKLEYHTTTIIYLLNGIVYLIEPDSIFIETADSVEDRIDMFTVDINSKIIYNKGLADGNLNEPIYNSDTELFLKLVRLNANASFPVDAGYTQVYIENEGYPTEWDATFIDVSGIPGDRIVVDSQAYPYDGSVSIQLSSVIDTDILAFNNEDGISMSEIGSFFFRMNPRVNKNFAISVKMFSDAPEEDSLMLHTLVRPNEHGHIIKPHSDYIDINIPRTSFTLGRLFDDNAVINRITMTFSYDSGISNVGEVDSDINLFIDDVKILKAGGYPREQNSFFSLMDVSRKTGEKVKDHIVAIGPDGRSIVFLDPEGFGASVFENDITVVLDNGRTLGRYANGQTIPSAGMTFEQFANDIAREYLKPQLSNFKNNIPGIVEVGTTLSGSVPFTWNYSQRNGDIQQVRIIDLEVGANHELATVANSSPKNATLTTRLLSAHLLTQRWVLKGLDINQGSDITTAPYQIQSQYYVFFGAVDSFPSNPSDGAANRTYAMNMTNKSSASKRFANQGPFTMHTLTTKRKYLILCPPGSTITRIEDTGNLDLDVKPTGYTGSPITIKDANGTDRSYTMWKADNQDDYSDDATHVIFITTP